MENQENLEREQQLVEEIRNLFAELVQAEEDKYLPPTYNHYLPPCNGHYVSKAKTLVAKAHELSELNPKYNADLLDDVLRKEVDMVDRHRYKYKKNSNEPTAKSKNKLCALMHDATYHIKLYFGRVLGDMACE